MLNTIRKFFTKKDMIQIPIVTPEDLINSSIRAGEWLRSIAGYFPVKPSLCFTNEHSYKLNLLHASVRGIFTTKLRVSLFHGADTELHFLETITPENAKYKSKLLMLKGAL